MDDVLVWATGLAATTLLSAGLVVGCRPATETDALMLRGREQTLRLYGRRGAPPVIVSSGDGGWIHLAPFVAERLAARGHFVVGFDTRAYLEAFSAHDEALRPADEPGDYLVLARYAAQGASERPILIGVSEGAGLSVLAATDPDTQHDIAGVIALGLPDINELAWRWRDSLIYLTHATPHEPTFRTSAIIGLVSPVPVAAIHATHDEYVPLADVQRVMGAARAPSRLWVVDAADHRFRNNLGDFERSLLDAVSWVRAHEAPVTGR